VDITRETLLADLTSLFGGERVITEENALKEYDSDMHLFAKAYGIYPEPMPICILNVESTEEVARALEYCNKHDVKVIPRTGASSYEGLLSVRDLDTIILDASGMNKILNIDYENMCVTCQCGVPLESLENMLQEKGFTTGHSPQSIPVAQMGGLVATRSIGQFSTYYGGIEDMLCALEAVMPDGSIVRIRNVPRRAAGPDLRHLFMGSEGALAVITEVTVKIFTYYPDTFWRGGYIVPNMAAGFKAIRNIMAAGFRPSVVRLYDKDDFDFNFGSVELKEGEAYMFFVAEGPPAIAAATGEGVDKIAREMGGRYIGHEGVDHWLIHRNDLCKKFMTEEVREVYRETPVFYSTTEIAASYTDIIKIYENVKKNVPLKVDNMVMIGGHVSHAYQTGVNIYFVYMARVEDPEKYVAVHQSIIDAVCEEVLAMETGGCVHHHGMGKQRVKFAAREHGSSYGLMKDLKQMMDPKGIMNPGVLVEK